MIPERVCGVIFDFDGVITDSLQVHSAAWNGAFKSIFGHLPAVHDRSELTGRSSYKIAEFLCSLENAPERVEELVQGKLELLLSGDLPPLFEGTEALFTLLNSMQIPYGAASNAPTAFLRRVLSRCDYPPASILGYETVTHPKPAPDLFLACAESLNLSPADYRSVLVIEDSPTGITAAVSAGMRPVGVLTTHRRDQLEAAGAELILESISQMLPLIRELRPALSPDSMP